MDLATDGGQRFALFGATAGLKSGERVRGVGSRHKKLNGITARRSIVVEKVEKDYGACPVAPVP